MNTELEVIEYEIAITRKLASVWSKSRDDLEYVITFIIDDYTQALVECDDNTQSTLLKGKVRAINDLMDKMRLASEHILEMEIQRAQLLQQISAENQNGSANANMG